MSAVKVDVLAVMGRMATASFVAADDHPESAALARLQRDAEEARAAVAELIEALRESDAALAVCRARWPFQPSPAQMPAAIACAEARRRNAAALARIGGDA